MECLNVCLFHPQFQDFFNRLVSRGEEDSAEPSATVSATTINNNLELEFSDLSFVTRFSSKNKEPILTVMQRELYYHPPFDHASIIYLVINFYCSLSTC